MEYNDHVSSPEASKKSFPKLLNIIKQKRHVNSLKKNVYRPINPSHPFNSRFINSDEILKKRNALLINNKNIKDMVLKYNNDKINSYKIKKNHHYYYDQFKDEEKKYYMAVKVILKKDFNHLPQILTEKKEKKSMNSRLNNSRNNHIFDKLSFNINNKSLGFLSTHQNLKSINSETINTENDIFQYNDKNPKNKNFLMNSYKTTSFDLKERLMKKVSRTKPLNNSVKIKLKNICNLNIKKPLSFSVTNMNSAKIGKISIFGVFEDNGTYGKKITSLLINFFIDYFQRSQEISVCLEKDNFYSILHWAFINAQNYLIKNAKRFNVDLSYSGCMGTILIVPKNGSFIFYCANSGKCKCIIYTTRGIDDLYFMSNIDRPSERDRIFEFNKKKTKKSIKDLSKEETKETTKNDDKKNTEQDKAEKQISTENNKNSFIKEAPQEEKIDEEKYIRYFKSIGITRCFGNTSGSEMGLVPDPEVTECDIKASKVKFAVLGNTIFWKYIDEKELRFVVSKYQGNNDTIGATKELEDLIKQKVGISSKILNEYSFVVVFFDAII